VRAQPDSPQRPDGSLAAVSCTVDTCEAREGSSAAVSPACVSRVSRAWWTHGRSMHGRRTGGRVCGSSRAARCQTHTGRLQCRDRADTRRLPPFSRAASHAAASRPACRIVSRTRTPTACVSRGLPTRCGRARHRAVWSPSGQEARPDRKARPDRPDPSGREAQRSNRSVTAARTRHACTERAGIQVIGEGGGCNWREVYPCRPAAQM
jgi:hypothetical protein